MMTYSRNGWMAVSAALVMAGTALAQVSIESPGGGNVMIAPPTTAAAPPTGTTRAATAPAASMPSAANVLQQLLNNKPGVDGATTMGAGSVLIAPLGPPLGADGLLREGQQLELRWGYLKKEGGAMMFVFDPKGKPAYPAMGVVPSKRLASMEDAAGFGEGRSGNDQNFQITAEVTQYRGKNYLYIKPSGVPVPAPAIPPKPSANGPLVDPVAPHVPEAAPMPQGNVISRRIGRLVRDARTGAELIAFDSDGKLMADPPMGVIPCQYLAVMEDATDHGNKPLKFWVSGEVTTYRGKNYLYLKYVKVVTDLNGGIGAGANPVAVGG